MEMKLKRIDTATGIVHLKAHGAMTGSDLTPDASNPLEQAAGEQWSSQKLVIDFSDVSYIDSSAIGWLINSQKQMAEDGGRLVLYSLQPRVRQLFDMIKLDMLVPMVANDEAAEEAINGEKV